MVTLIYFIDLVYRQDPALMRPGRFDRLLYVEPPDQKAREEILRIRMGKMSVGPDVDIAQIAQVVSCIYLSEQHAIPTLSCCRRRDVLELKLLPCVKKPPCSPCESI